jgi:hypothetical protein
MSDANIWTDAWDADEELAGGRAPLADPRRRGGAMSESEEGGATVAELLLCEPEIVAWLDDYRPAEDDTDGDDEPPSAA